MTLSRSSLPLSGCFVTLLIWGCSSVAGLLSENLTVHPATTIGYHSTVMMAGDVTGMSSLSFACGTNSPECPYLCQYCEDKYAAPAMQCLSEMFQHMCLYNFESAMASLNNTDWCIWKNINRLYNELSRCTESKSDCLLIPYPNPLVEQIFVEIHSRFFMNCTSEELSDPPPAIVFALVITPICLIPIMVSLVVLKTKNGDGSS